MCLGGPVLVVLVEARREAVENLRRARALTVSRGSGGDQTRPSGAEGRKSAEPDVTEAARRGAWYAVGSKPLTGWHARAGNDLIETHATGGNERALAET